MPNQPKTPARAVRVDGALWHSGDRVYRWWDAGYKFDPQPLTVVRVNRVTVTVRTDQGSEFRLPPHEIAGPWTEDE